MFVDYTEEQLMVQEMARDVVAREIAPLEEEYDFNRPLTNAEVKEIWKRLTPPFRKIGEVFDFSDIDYISLGIFVEEAFKVNPSLACVIGISVTPALMLHLFGRPRTVTAMCRQLVIDTEGKGEDTAAVTLDLGEGMLGSIVVTFADDATRYRGERRIVGTAGTLLIRDMPEDELPLVLLTGEDLAVIPVRNPLQVQPLAVELTLNDLIGAIVEDREPVASTQLARDTLAVVLAAYESDRTGRRVGLPWAETEVNGPADAETGCGEPHQGYDDSGH